MLIDLDAEICWPFQRGNLSQTEVAELRLIRKNCEPK